MNDKSMRVPRIFHFVYGLRPQTRPFHLAHYLSIESCIRVNRPDRVLFHYRHPPWGRYWDLIRDKLELVSVTAPKVELKYDDPRIEAYLDSAALRTGPVPSFVVIGDIRPRILGAIVEGAGRLKRVWRKFFSRRGGS